MEVERISQLISSVIESDSFKNMLEKVNCNYPNLKQENHIRNLILEELNEGFKGTDVKAFAEHPRENKTRVDLSIVNKNNPESPIKIEFKYQFSGDFKSLSDYSFVIRNDFLKRNSELFILVIADWNIADKQKFDDTWKITPSLNRYIAKSENWKSNILKSFEEFKDAKLKPIDAISISHPYLVEYHFYMLQRI